MIRLSKFISICDSRISHAARCALRLLIVALVLLTGGNAARAGEAARWTPMADIVFQRIATEGGAPNTLGPTAAVEDGDGFLWIGTQNGLVRWDGYHFRNYKPDLKTPGSLPDSFVQTLHADRQGRLWIGTASRGLARYDREHDRFISHASVPNALSHASVTSIADAADGGLWIGTEGGLDHLDPASGRVTHHHHDAANPLSLPDDSVTDVLLSRKGELWIGTSKGLVRGDAGGSRFVALPLPGGDGERKVNRLLEDSLGRIWVGTAHHGASIVEPDTGRVSVVRETGAAAGALPTETITALAQTANGEVWLGTNGNGIVAVELQGSSTRRIVHDVRLPSSLDNNDIWVLYRDRAGLMWAGTGLSLSRHDPGSTAVLTLFGASGRERSLSHEEVISVTPMPGGLVWLGAGTNGIDVFDPERGRVGALRPDPRHPATALPRARVITVLPVNADEVYIGTHQGLYRSDAAGRRVTRVAIAGRSPTEAVWALHHDLHGLWVGGSDGLWLLAPGAGGRMKVLHDDDLAPGLADHRITLIQPAPDGRLWIGTRGGLNRLDVATRTVEAIGADPQQAPGLAGGFINALLTDAAGRLWVGTAGSGVHLIDNPGAKVSRVTAIDGEQGLPNGNVSKLLADGAGRVWASTDAGLAVIDAKTLAVRALGPADGVAISTYWINSGASTAQGELLFGGLGGLTVVRPERLQRWRYRPPVVVTDVRVGGASMPVGIFNRPGHPGLLTIPPGTRSLAVEFSALDFSAPEHNRYAYRLTGFDPDWIDTEPARRLAVYTNLPPGEHVLELRGSNREGAWAPASLRLPIRVLPAWYQTNAFRLALAALALTGIAALVQARTLLLRRRQRVLEQQVAERTAALELRTAELQESERRLERMAYFDVLTGLPNRRMFSEHFERLLGRARREGIGFALLLIDLDRFKQINDSLGHAAGDALLVEAAARLRRIVREVDSVARLGGDEFAMLLSDAQQAAEIEAACQRMIDSFAEPMAYNESAMKTSPSIGVAFYPNHGDTLDALYLSADAALYQAKGAGRNTWRCFVALRGHQETRLAIEAEQA